MTKKNSDKAVRSKYYAAFTGALIGLMASTASAQSAETPMTAEELLVHAQFLEDVGAAERINYAGKLRMLSQRIPAAACNTFAEIESEASGTMLQGSVAEFEKIVAALQHGDEELGINGAETRRKTLAAIEAVRQRATPVEEIAAKVAGSVPSIEDVQYLADQNMATLEDAKLLVSEVSGQYADPTALLQADALRIDIAGRQRMLTQKISKEICFIASGINAEASLEVLSSTVNMFEVSLDALQNGMPNAGIGPAPNDEIAAQLTKVAGDWNAIKPHIETVVSGGDLSAAERADVFNGLNKTMVDMNVAVGMFAESSKLGL